MMIRDLQAHVPGGTYTVLYDGEGVLDFSMDVTGVRHVEAGRAEVDIKPSTGGNNGEEPATAVARDLATVMLLAPAPAGVHFWFAYANECGSSLRPSGSNHFQGQACLSPQSCTSTLWNGPSPTLVPPCPTQACT